MSPTFHFLFFFYFFYFQFFSEGFHTTSNSFFKMSLIHEFGTVIARITLDPAPFVDVSDAEMVECMKHFTDAELDAMSLFNLIYPKEVSKDKIPKVSSKAKQYLRPIGKRVKFSNYIPVAQRPLGPNGERARILSNYIPVAQRPLGPNGERAKILSNYIPVAQRPLGPDGKRAKCFSKYIKKANRISVLV